LVVISTSVAKASTTIVVSILSLNGGSRRGRERERERGDFTYGTW
jgi:hypothetical protein